MGTVSVNGVTINVPDGASVSIINGDVVIDGKPYKGMEKVKPEESIFIEGDFYGNIQTSRSVEVKGNVSGNVDANGSVTCKNVTGNVDANGSVTCGNVGGDVDAGGSVRMSR